MSTMERARSAPLRTQRTARARVITVMLVIAGLTSCASVADAQSKAERASPASPQPTRPEPEPAPPSSVTAAPAEASSPIAPPAPQTVANGLTPIPRVAPRQARTESGVTDAQLSPLPVSMGAAPDPRTDNAPAGSLAGQGNVHLQFLVRLNDDTGISFRDQFLADPAIARAAFEAYAEENPVFSGLALVRVSYSGELTLRWAGALPTDPTARAQLSDRIQARLRAEPNVQYADPNLVGWKG